VLGMLLPAGNGAAQPSVNGAATWRHGADSSYGIAARFEWEHLRNGVTQSFWLWWRLGHCVWRWRRGRLCGRARCAGAHCGPRIWRTDHMAAKAASRWIRAVMSTYQAILVPPVGEWRCTLPMLAPDGYVVKLSPAGRAPMSTYLGEQARTRERALRWIRAECLRDGFPQSSAGG